MSDSEEQLTLFAGASPASPLASPAPSAASSTNDGSGPSSPELFASLEPDGWSSKMSPGYLALEIRTRLTAAYVAGLIDGEACIYLARRRKWYTARCDIGMAEKGLPILQMMKHRYGGSLRKSREATAKWAAVWTWTLHSRQCKAMLREVLPYLKLKREQAILILNYKTAHKETTVSLIRDLNRKGPSKEPTGGWFARAVGEMWLTPQRDYLSPVLYQEFSETWPSSGLMLSGRAYRLPRAAPRISGTGSGWLPTPTTPYGSGQNGQRADGTTFKQAGKPSLDTMARKGMIPTPWASDGEKGGPNQRGSKGDLTLPSFAQAWVPTPTAGDAKSAGSGNCDGSSANFGVSLTDWARGDSGRGRVSSKPGQRRGQLTYPAMNVVGPGGLLSPRFVEALMAFPDNWTQIGETETPDSER